MLKKILSVLLTLCLMLPLFALADQEKEPFLFRKGSRGRGTRTRTQNKGFMR